MVDVHIYLDVGLKFQDENKKEASDTGAEDECRKRLS